MGNGRCNGDQRKSYRFAFHFTPISLIEVDSLLMILSFYFLDFFIALDHENGPITLHSSLSKVVKYIQSGLQKLKQM